MFRKASVAGVAALVTHSIATPRAQSSRHGLALHWNAISDPIRARFELPALLRRSFKTPECSPQAPSGRLAPAPRCR
jgi:hypothetical protein